MKLSKNKKWIVVISLAILALGAWGLFRFGIRPAGAQSSQGLMDVSPSVGWTSWFTNPGDTLLWAIGRLIQALVWIGGQILAVLMWVLFKIARYNNFIDSPAVVNGWVIVRDLCNIFFVVIFLVMTVATVLGIADYSYNRILSNLLIMVVLINFSKLICGIFIDISQVIMLTFMNSFGKLGSGYLTEILGITDLLNQAKANMAAGFNDTSPFFSHLGSYLLVLVYVIVAVGTILVIILVLVQRIIMLWIYVVLSPFAYALKTFPAGASYANKWWGDFVKYLTIGPIIAFFMWLSFVSLGNVSTDGASVSNSQKTFQDLGGAMSQSEMQAENTAFSGAAVANMDSFPQAGETTAGTPSHVVKFIIAIAMLWGGLITAQTIGGMAGKFAGSTMGALSDMGTAAVDWSNRLQAGGLGFKVSEKLPKWAQYALKPLNVIGQGTGQDLSPSRRWALIKAGMDRNKKKDIQKIEDRADQLHEMRGVFGAVAGTGSRDWYEQRVKGFLGIKGALHAVRSTFTTPQEFGEKADEAMKKKAELARQREATMTQEEKDDRGKELEKRMVEATKANEKSKEALTKLTDEITKLEGILEDPSKKAASNYSGWSDDKVNDLLTKKKESLPDAKKKQSAFEQKLKQMNDEKEKWASMEVVNTKEEADKKRAELDKKIKEQDIIADKANKQEAKYMIVNPEAQRARRAAEADEQKNLLSDNSDELIMWFRNAVASGNSTRAAAIMKKLAKNYDTNEIMKAYGYNTSIGLTTEELNQLKIQGKTKEIAERRGLHDFMRDIMMDKLKMDEQLAFSLESELGGIHKETNQAAYQDAVGVKHGKYHQNDYKMQNILADDHLAKQDAEGIFRKGPRFAFGGEDINGNFKVHAAGLNLLLGKYDIMAKEMKGNRFNPKVALKLSEEENMKKLRQAAETLSGENKKEYLSTLDRLEVYGSMIRAGMTDIGSQMEKLANVINDETATKKKE